MKFVVEYTLPYVHVVRVGVAAATQEKAIEKAEQAFSDCSIWEDTKKIPLLEDVFEEVGDTAEAVRFTAEACRKWPKRSRTVRNKKSDEWAQIAVELLVAAYKNGAESSGSVDWSDLDAAAEAARKSARLRK